MKQIAILCLLLAQSTGWSQSDTTRFVIRTYGFASWSEHDELEYSIADTWKIDYLPVAGCVVTDEFVDSIEQLNKITHRRLEAQYGADWQERFNNEVDSAYKNLLSKKENTFQEIANCKTEDYSLKVSENLSQTRKEFTINSSKAKASNSNISIIGLQNSDPTILYRGYENFISLEFGTFEGLISIKSKGNLFLMDTCLTSSNIQFSYRVSGSSKTDTLFVETSDGQTQAHIFNIKNLEAPKLYLNEWLLDSTLNITDLTGKSILSMRMEKSCLLPERFTIHSWEISCSGNKLYIGAGNEIPYSTIRKLKKLQPGSNFCIRVIVSSKDCILRKKITCVTLI